MHIYISMKVNMIDGINLQLMKNGHHIGRWRINCTAGVQLINTTRQMHILQQDDLSK